MTKKEPKEPKEPKRAPRGPHVVEAAQYPRPQLRRDKWDCLDGPWQFHIDEGGHLTAPADVRFAATIQAPFAPETPASGVHDTRPYKAVWYRREFAAPELAAGERLLLHFGAVDYEANVWVNGQVVARHEGGYTPFFADVTDVLADAGANRAHSIVVRAFDDPHDLAKPRGKQDWKPKPHSIWYDRTTGIWQSVWLEVVPATHLAALRWRPDAERWEIGLEVHVAGPLSDDLWLHVTLRAGGDSADGGGRILAEDSYRVTGPETRRRLGIPDPGIDDARNELLWSPERPRLIEAEIELRHGSGVAGVVGSPANAVIDRVTSYTALRQAGVLGDRFVLNGKPYPLRLVLNQGYWEQSGLTAPDGTAFRRDVELLKRMGFNGVRMHQKIEDPRFLYWCDKLGLIVWGEMPSAYTFSPQTVRRVTEQWTQAVLRDVSHPCIVAWVPINESWGVPDLPASSEQRHFIRSLYHLTKSLDPTRPVIGNDGWEAAETDVVAVHDYDADPARIARRYSPAVPGWPGIEHLFRSERPGHKLLILDGFSYAGQPLMLTEFGGIAFSDRSGTWGYSRAESANAFARHYYRLLTTVRSLPLFAGFCYTQFTDTYQEANGLLYMDRTPKIPIDAIATATRGAQSPEEHAIEAAWRKEEQRGRGGLSTQPNS